MNFVSTWAQGVIVAVIIATIIEMLLPNNGNGKYVKVVVGIFVLFSIISPIVGKFKRNDSDLGNLDAYLNSSSNKSIETSGLNIDNEEAIRKMYEENLKIDIKSKVNQKGYITGDINLDISNDSEYILNKIELCVVGKNESNTQENNAKNTTTIVENIENVKISLGGSRNDEKQEKPSIISESEKRKLKEYLSSVYEVNEKAILIF